MVIKKQLEIEQEDEQDVSSSEQLDDQDNDVEQEVSDAEIEEEEDAMDVDEDVLVDKEQAKIEKQRLREQERKKKEALQKLRREQNEVVAEGAEQRESTRLNFLMQQAEVFQHFTGNQKKEQVKQKKGGGRLKGRKEEDEDQELLEEDDTVLQKVHRLQQQPSMIIGGSMRDYQIQGLNWMIHLYDNGINGILADEMGLGKTLQTISLLAYLSEYRGITGPHIVIVPKSTIGNWLKEFKRWCPTIRCVKFHGNQEQRAIQKASVVVHGKFDVVVTSYEMVIKEKSLFKKFHFRYTIIDEAHRIKNENSLLSKVVRMLRTNYRLLITGTPLQNNLHELWALLNFLLPEVFSSSEKFEEWFNITEGGKEKEAEVVQQLHKVLRPFLLRRVKSDVERGLPPKKETILRIGMSDMQRKYYAALIQKDIDTLSKGTMDRSRLLNIVMQLRKCCNHPYLFEGAEPGPPYETGPHLVTNSGKMVLLDKLLPKLKERGSRVLIFSQMTRMLDILEDYLIYSGYQYCRIDGNTVGDDRDDAIETFNKDGSEKFVFLLSTRAGGLGINLATADIVIILDSDWNPQMDLQAMDRAHRIGQKKEVKVFRFCVENSIEEKVIEKAYKKLRLDAMVIQQGRLQDNTQKKLGKDDLLNMVKYGAELVFQSSEAGNITDADIDAIIRKGEDATDELNEKMKAFTDNAKNFTVNGGFAYDYKDPNEEEAQLDMTDLAATVGRNWQDLPERRRKKVIYTEQPVKDKIKDVTIKPPRLPKMPNLQDFQFFNVKRITEIYEKEHNYEIWKHNREHKRQQLKAQGFTEEEDIELQLKQDDEEEPQVATEEDLDEKERLLEQGFSNWSRRELNAFVRACEKYGRGNIDQIAKDLDSKSKEEVEEYAAVFWKRYKELNDWEKIIKNIERGEAKIQRQLDIMDAIASKMDRYKNPWNELKFQYGQAKGKSYTEDEDRFIVCMTRHLGYGQWEELKSEIRKSWRFRFDWFIKSRTPQELNRRCDTLIRVIEKEIEDLDAAENPDRRKTKRSYNAQADTQGAAKKKKNQSLSGIVQNGVYPNKREKFDSYQNNEVQAMA